MVIKNKFTLLKGIPNVLDVSPNTLKAASIKNGVDKTKSVVGMIGNKMDHYANKRVYSLLKKEGSFNVVSLPSYPLAVSYNKPTKSIIINLNFFGLKDISPTNPNPRDLYACLTYGICFSRLINKDYVLPPSMYNIISSYLLSVFIRVYGKEYGLLGYYSSQIPKLKFIINCYILTSFFGEKNKTEMYRRAAVGLAYRYSNDLEILDKADFSDISGFIQALSDLSVMPGLNRYRFTAKILRFLSINFIPALEDCARFMSVMTTTNVPGVTFIPSFVYRYNEEEYNKIIKISELIFK